MFRIKLRTLIFSMLPWLSGLLCEAAADRPNLVLILADDMGYSDIEPFGGEIDTPNLSRLARQGLKMTHFYNTARCCPSRASLLTGQHPHAAGMGSMADQDITLPSYRGFLGRDVVTLAEVLGEAGYDTFISGKWHVGDERPHWPDKRGFKRVFSNLEGAGSYWDKKPYRNADWPWSDGKITTVLDDREVAYPDGEYTTDVYTDYALEFMENSLAEGRPFFLYLPYTAPHWPLHAPKADIRKYEGRYDEGWEVLRRERFERQRDMGLFPREVTLPGSNPKVPDWDGLNEAAKENYRREMEVYAAMVDVMDQNIGRLIRRLEDHGQFDNTLIIFLSDNGAANADGVSYLHERFDPDAPVGGPKSFDAYGPGWAQASNTPFRNFKATAHEGGIATPFVACYPDRIPPGRVSHARGHLIDLMPTFIELAEAEYPEVYQGRSIRPLPGQSLLPVFDGSSWDLERALAFEHHGHRAVVYENYKLVAPHNKDWELYDLVNDRSETRDVIGEIPAAYLLKMLGVYWDWSYANGVYPKDIVEKRVQR